MTLPYYKRMLSQKLKIGRVKDVILIKLSFVLHYKILQTYLEFCFFSVYRRNGGPAATEPVRNRFLDAAYSGMLFCAFLFIFDTHNERWYKTT